MLLKRSLTALSVVSIYTSSFLAFSSKAHAAGGACSQSGGAIIFQDTLYGLGTGTLIGGLVLLTQDKHDNVAQKLATGGLIGAGLGLGFGFYDVSSRNCNQAASVKPGWSNPQLAFNPVSSDFSVKMQFDF